jgi:Flp pilus assembly protein TadG
MSFLKRCRGESGSAVVEFVFISIPLLLTSFTSLMIVQAGYVHNLLLDAAVEGSRYAANADGDLASGVQRAEEILKQTIGEANNRQIKANYRLLSGQKAAEIRIQQEIPSAGLLLMPLQVEAVARATLQLQK